MKKLFKNTEKFFIQRDVWVWGAAILLISMIKVNFEPPATWSNYIFNIFTFTILFLPVLFFEWYKPRIKDKLTKIKYLFYWTLFFVGYPIILVWIINTWLHKFISSAAGDEFFIVMGLAIFYFGLAIEINNSLSKKIKTVTWIKKISLEKAVFIILLFIALFFALMAVSNLEMFYEKQRFDTSIDVYKVADNFFTFISFTTQFLIAYSAGYFFYFINHKILIPKLLKNRGIFIYVCGLIGTIVLFYPLLAQLLLLLPISNEIIPIIPSENFAVFDERNGMAAFAIMIISIPIILAVEWFKQNSEITTLEKEKIETELSLLKQQINPHFFFNTLNNLYALSLKNAKETPDVILKLSELMRYVIYKGKDDEVLLADEIKYIEDYIELQQIRLHKKLTFEFEKNVEDNNLRIPPLIFIIFIENAFKHGIEPAEKKCTLLMNLASTKNNLTFVCENSFENTETENQGIGLENLKRRLELRFRNKYELLTEKNETSFKATLKLDLS